MLVEPVHPLNGRELDVIDTAPWATSSNDFGFEQPNDSLCQSVVIGVSDGANGRDEASFGRSLGVANREILHPAIAMVNQLSASGSRVQRLLKRVEGKVAPQRAGDAQPTMSREKTSMTNATYTNPADVATYVKSATQSWFGLVATN